MEPTVVEEKKLKTCEKEPLRRTLIVAVVVTVISRCCIVIQEITFYSVMSDDSQKET